MKTVRHQWKKYGHAAHVYGYPVMHIFEYFAAKIEHDRSAEC